MQTLISSVLLRVVYVFVFSLIVIFKITFHNIPGNQTEAVRLLGTFRVAAEPSLAELREAPCSFVRAVPSSPLGIPNKPRLIC